jgi:hypothetical protein
MTAPVEQSGDPPASLDTLQNRKMFGPAWNGTTLPRLSTQSAATTGHLQDVRLRSGEADLACLSKKRPEGGGGGTLIRLGFNSYFNKPTGQLSQQFDNYHLGRTAPNFTQGSLQTIHHPAAAPLLQKRIKCCDTCHSGNCSADE